MNLTCTKCREEKDEEQFRWRSKKQGTRQTWCKVCFSSHEKMIWQANPGRRKRSGSQNKDRRLRNAQFVYDYLLSHPCGCGEADPVVLEFDHRDGTNKLGTISEMSRASLSLYKLQTEMSKCRVLCANCHRRRTAKQFGWYRSLSIGSIEVREIVGKSVSGTG